MRKKVDICRSCSIIPEVVKYVEFGQIMLYNAFVSIITMLAKLIDEIKL